MIFPTDTEIRTADLSSSGEISETEKECFSDPWDEKTIKNTITGDIYGCIEARVGEETAGHLIYQFISPECEILRVAVREKFRRHGIGRKMMQYLFSELEKPAYKKLTYFIEVRESNAPAISLYKSVGFYQIYVRKNYYRNPTESALILKKDFGDF